MPCQACYPPRPAYVYHDRRPQFDDDFYEFRCSIKELERRLGAVVSLAFDDCATVYGRFKLLDSFEGLLERPIIQVQCPSRKGSATEDVTHAF